MKLKKSTTQGFLFFLLLIPTFCFAQNAWVYGEVDLLEEYGSVQNGAYEVLISLSNKSWPNGGLSECVGQFRLKNGVQGVTEEIKQRIFSIALSANMASKPIGLFVNSPGGAVCNIQAARVGNLP